MNRPKHSFGTMSSLVSLDQSKKFCLVLKRAEAARRHRAIEEQAKASRRNLQNPANFAWCATKVAANG